MYYVIAVPIVVLVIVGVVVPLIIWHGYALWVMWGWFIVPLGAPQISVPWAIGFAAVAHLLQPEHFNPPAKNYAERWGRALSPFARPAIILLLGYFAKSFM